MRQLSIFYHCFYHLPIIPIVNGFCMCSTLLAFRWKPHLGHLMRLGIWNLAGYFHKIVTFRSQPTFGMLLKGRNGIPRAQICIYTIYIYIYIYLYCCAEWMLLLLQCLIDSKVSAEVDFYTRAEVSSSSCRSSSSNSDDDYDDEEHKINFC